LTDVTNWIVTVGVVMSFMSVVTSLVMEDLVALPNDKLILSSQLNPANGFATN
jgi:hypothetical protein